MFCDALDNVLGFFEDMGLFNIPLLGCILAAIADFWWDILGCDVA